MAATRVFISFDYDHDVDLKNALVGQSRLDDSPFEVQDWSIKDASPTWKAEARNRIRRSDQVIVMCGASMTTATGADVEVGIARDEGKPYFLLAGRQGATRPASCAMDTLYSWTWPNLKLLISGAR